jgi:hypothetical protein
MKSTVVQGDIKEPLLPLYVPDASSLKDTVAPETTIVSDRPTVLPPTDKPVPSVTKHQTPLPKPENASRRYPQQIRQPTQKLDL